MKKQLSKLEGRIMDMIWMSDCELSISDMCQQLQDLSELSIRQVVTRLEKKGLLQVTGFRKQKKSVVQLYSATIKQSAYVQECLSQSAWLELSLGFVKQSGDKDALNGLRQMLDEKIEELEKKVQ